MKKTIPLFIPFFIFANAMAGNQGPMSERLTKIHESQVRSEGNNSEPKSKSAVARETMIDVLVVLEKQMGEIPKEVSSISDDDLGPKIFDARLALFPCSSFMRAAKHISNYGMPLIDVPASAMFTGGHLPAKRQSYLNSDKDPGPAELAHNIIKEYPTEVKDLNVEDQRNCEKAQQQFVNLDREQMTRGLEKMLGISR